MIFKVGNKVRLPFHETGIVVDIKERLWGTIYYVRITCSNGFNPLGKTVDFFEKHLALD